MTIDYLLDAGSEVSEESAEDAHFFRNYQKMDPKSKAALKAMVNKWTESDE